jgi:hypothetical protein
MHFFPAAHPASIAAAPAITVPGHIASSPAFTIACYLMDAGLIVYALALSTRPARRTRRLNRPARRPFR